MHVNAQDSLEFHLNSLENEDNVSRKVYSADKLAEYYFERDLDSALYVINKAYSFTEENTIDRAILMHDIGVISNRQQKYDEAIAYYDSATVIFERFGSNEHLLSVNNNRARAKYTVGESYEAMKLLNSNYDYFKQQDLNALTFSDQRNYISTLNLLASIQHDLQNYEKAMEFDKKSFEYAYKIGDSIRYIICKTNYGTGLIKSGDSAGAIRVFSQNMRFKRRNGYVNHYGIEEFKLGQLYSQMGREDSAELYYQKALDIFEVNNPNAFSTDRIKIQLAGLFLKKGQLQKSFEFCSEGYARSLESNNVQNQLIACECLMRYYKMTNDYQKAFSFQSKAYKIQEELSFEEVATEIEKNSLRFEFSRQQYEDSLAIATKNNEMELTIAKQESDISRKNWVTAILLISTLILLGLIYVIYKQFKKTEIQKIDLSVALGDKEVLLKEIHHRVKNNFQVISSLLNLQAHNLKDESQIKPLRDAQNRIGSMALVHQKLYRSKSLAKVEMYQYFQSLISSLKEGFLESADKLQLSLVTNSIELDLDKTVPLGLIVNEMVTNSFKYGESDNGLVYINLSMKQEGDSIIFKYSDKGKGLPKDLDLDNLNSLGMELIQILSEQIGGELSIENRDGTAFTIKFVA